MKSPISANRFLISCHEMKAEGTDDRKSIVQFFFIRLKVKCDNVIEIELNIGFYETSSLQSLGIRTNVNLCSYVHFFNSRDINISPLLATHRYHTRHRDRLRPPQHRQTLFHNSFLYQAPTFWNTVTNDFPSEIKNAPNCRLFNKRQKKQLLR